MIDNTLIGEVVAAYPPSHKENDSGLRWEYSVKCNLSNGASRTFLHCIATEAFSGILNYVQQVAPATAHGTTEAYAGIESSGARKGTVGARCVLAFPSGDSRYPVILGWLPHESSPIVIGQPANTKDAETQLKDGEVYPVLNARFNGMDFLISEIGEFTISHYGYTGIESKLYESVTLTPPKPEYLTRMRFLEKGQWEVADSTGQMIALDPVTNIMEFSNTSAQLLFNQKEKLVSLVSTGNLEEITQVDRYRFVGGNEKIVLKKEQDVLIETDAKREIKGKITEKVTGEAKFTFENKFTFAAKETKLTFEKFTLEAKETELKTTKLTSTCSGDTLLEASGGAKLKLSSGKVALGASGTELIDQVIKAIDSLLPANQPNLCMTGVGPSGPLLPPAAATLTAIKTALGLIKGSL